MGTSSAANGWSSGFLSFVAAATVSTGVLLLAYQVIYVLQFGVWPIYDMYAVLNWVVALLNGVGLYGISPNMAWILRLPLGFGLIATGGVVMWLSRVAREMNW
jgi:hypothetical protein